MDTICQSIEAFCRGNTGRNGPRKRKLRLRLAGQSSSDPIKQRPQAPTADRSKTPAIWTELRNEGLTTGGPLQKPAFLTLRGAGHANRSCAGKLGRRRTGVVIRGRQNGNATAAPPGWWRF